MVRRPTQGGATENKKLVQQQLQTVAKTKSNDQFILYEKKTQVSYYKGNVVFLQLNNDL